MKKNATNTSLTATGALAQRLQWLIYLLPVLCIDAKFDTQMSQAIMVNIDKITIMAAMACLYQTNDSADIGVHAKNRQNIDEQWKRN